MKIVKNLELSNDELYIELKVTTHCNLNCKYCFSKNNNSNENIDHFIEKIIFFLNSYKSNYNKYIFYIYGGEPLLYKNLIRTIQILKEQLFNSCEFIIQSNGSLLLTEPDIKMYKRLNCLFKLSFHPDEVNINTFIKNCKILKKFYILDDVNILLTKINYSKIKIIQKILDSFYIKYSITIIFQDYDFFNKNKKLLKEMNLNFDHKIIEIIDKQNITKYSSIEMALNNFNNYYGWHCSAGSNTILINNDGKIYRCEFDLINNKNPIFDLFNPVELLTFDKDCKNIFCNQYHTTKWCKDENEI